MGLLGGIMVSGSNRKANQSNDQEFRFWPNSVIFEEYLELRGFRSRADFFIKLVIVVVLLYAILFWQIFGEAPTTITGTAYQKISPILVWVMPAILYAAQIF